MPRVLLRQLVRAPKAQRAPRRSEKGYYRHDSLPDDAARSGILTDDRRRDLMQLYGWRIKADYHDDPVEFEEADRAAELARRLVEGLLE